MSEILEVICLVFWAGLFFFVMFKLFSSIRVVPQRYAQIVERLGRYHVTLNSGFHILIPFLDRVAFTLDLKEESVDVPPQECFTFDEVKVVVDGVIYISVLDPVKAAYGVSRYRFAAMQLAQTTTRSVIGKLSLDKTFEEREFISAAVVSVLEQTADTWGIRVHRYEIKNIRPPASVQQAMEKQVRAERERRAVLARSEGEKQSRINRSEGLQIEMVNNSEGEKQKRINEAEGYASEIRSLADATAGSIEKVAHSILEPGGQEAVRLQLVERYLGKLSSLGRKETNVVLPLNLANLKELVSGLGLDDKHS